MLSILIPIYEVKVVKLVNKLVKQCHVAKIEFEIICFDDGSSEKVKTANKAIDLVMGVNYVELSENKGRAKVRNMLAKMARYEYLLYLDCDSKLQGKKLIKNYLSQLAERKVICGGRVYEKSPPKDIQKMLHWKYGSRRESRSVSYRNRKKVSFFHSNNFVIDRHTMFENPFDETIIGYGYEDLALAYQLNQRGVEIIHIDNPTVHDGLEKADIFIDKSIQAATNLWSLYKQGRVPHTRLIKAFKFLDTYYLKTRYLLYFNERKNKITGNLQGNDPKLYNLDMMKLAHYCDLSIEWQRDKEFTKVPNS
ncbi:MAG: glycosyltransferase [Saprospiraceae bacterium]